MTHNPYQTPEAEFSELETTGPLAGLTPKQVQKLYYRSSNLSAIVGLQVLALIGLSVLLFTGGSPGTILSAPILVGLIIFYGAAALGMGLRTIWGRYIGMVVCTLSLISIPFGTIVGLVGLFALIAEPKLFGPDRITHKEVKERYKELKQAKLIPFWRLW